MAYATPQHPVTFRVLSILSWPFVAFGNFVISIGEANSRSQALRLLMAQSDAELAKRGLNRDDLVHHAYSDSYYL